MDLNSARMVPGISGTEFKEQNLRNRISGMEFLY
jgi:hypothetical protein